MMHFKFNSKVFRLNCLQVSSLLLMFVFVFNYVLVVASAEEPVVNTPVVLPINNTQLPVAALASPAAQVAPLQKAPAEIVLAKPKQLPAASVNISNVKNGAKKDASSESETDIKSSGAEIDGLDTVSVREPEGNWLLKRMWWEKAEKKYGKIKDVVSKIIESRTPFFEKRNEFEKNVLNPFYTSTGLSSGQITQVVQALSERVKQDREENVTIDQKERAFLETIKAEENNLKQLDIDINGIKSLDAAIDQDLEKLDEQINRSRRYEDNAWQLFNAISKELSHKKARELYYKMDALWQNVKSIDGYIKDPFAKHFDLIIENANTQINRIKDTIEKFKTIGLDLKKKYKELFIKKDAKTIEQEKAKAKAEADAAAAAEAKAALEAEEAKTGIFGTIWNGVSWPFVSFWELVSSMWS